MPAPIGAEDLFRFRWIDHVRLSRDGERVAYQLSWADAEARQNRSRVVVRRLLDPEPVDPSGGPRRDHSPEWSPDGRRLAFISKVGAADQLFVAPVAVGGEPRQLTSIPEGVASPQWSPGGSRVAFIGTVIGDPDAVVDDPRPPESKEQARRPPVARIVRRLDAKHDGQGHVDGRYHHLFIVSADSGDVTQLTSGAWDVAGFDWSPDGMKLVVAGNAEPGADLQRDLNLYLIDLEANRQRLGGGFLLSSPAWSPRGDLIAFIAPNGLDAGLLERLWVVPLTGGGPRCLTLGFDQAVSDSVITDMRAGHGARLVWSTEGDRVYFIASGPGVACVYSSDLEGNIRQEVGGQRRVFDFDVASGTVAFAASDTSNPGELHLIMQGAETRLSDLNPWLRDRYIAQPERHQFTAPDGWLIEGWLLKPENLDPDRLHPLVMEVHGGPHGQYGWAFFHELQILAGMGYVVLYVNPRGSDGYGERFRREVVRDWGGKDYADLMSALDQLIERTGYVDTNRMGVGGGSYGGYMTNWIIGQTDRFSAAVAMRSISNLVSEYSQHDIVLWGALELGPPPWPDPDELWKRSPIRYVQNIRTPLLLTCGEMDLRCAISQSEEMFGALRLLGKTVEMVRFPDESHDLSRAGRPDRRVERLRRIAAWYQRFLGTAAIDRSDEPTTQVLPVPQGATRELVADTIAIGTFEEPAPVEPLAETEAVTEPRLEPEAVTEPRLEPEAVTEPKLEPEAAVEPAEAAVERWSEPHANVPEPDAQPEPEPQPEPAETFAEPEPEPELTPAALAPSIEPAAGEPETADQPYAAPEMAEPQIAEPEELPVFPEPEPPVPEPALSMPERAATSTESEPAATDQEAVAIDGAAFEPEPVSASTAVSSAEPQAGAFDEPQAPPAAVEAVQATQPPTPYESADRIAETIIAWPSGTDPGRPRNGSQGQPPETFEEATSIIPAWQPSDAPSDSKRTVSLQAMPPETIASGGAFAAMLAFESGPFAGRIVALPSQMVTIGRAPDNDVVVGDPATSGHHGRIEVRSGSFWISDLGSTNGTLVNGEPVIEKQLSDGDLIAIGQSTVRFTLES